MVKDHSDSEKGNPLPPHRLLLSINSKGSFICTIPQTVVEHWLEREIAQKTKRGHGVPGMTGDRLHRQVQGSTSSPTGVASKRRVYHFRYIFT